MSRDHMPGVRDVAVQKLRDLTLAIAIASTAAVGLIAWISAATIPGFTGAANVTGTTTSTGDDRSGSGGDDGLRQAPPGQAQFGSGVAVTGGSH